MTEVDDGAGLRNLQSAARKMRSNFIAVFTLLRVKEKDDNH